MKKHTDPLFCDQYYHIFNRGINGENVFREERNYSYFLKKYQKYILPIAHTYAYCLLKNHFHFLIKTRTVEDVLKNLNKNVPNVGRVWNPAGVNPADVDFEIEKEKLASKLLSQQFGHLFNGYSQAINKSLGRTGGLFEEPFRRISVEQESHCQHLVYYIHTNAQKHGLVTDFKEWPHSSYHAFLSTSTTRLCRDEVIDWFGGMKGFLAYHLEREKDAPGGLEGLEFD